MDADKLKNSSTAIPGSPKPSPMTIIRRQDPVVSIPARTATSSRSSSAVIVSLEERRREAARRHEEEMARLEAKEEAERQRLLAEEKAAVPEEIDFFIRLGRVLETMVHDEERVGRIFRELLGVVARSEAGVDDNETGDFQILSSVSKTSDSFPSFANDNVEAQKTASHQARRRRVELKRQYAVERSFVSAFPFHSSVSPATVAVNPISYHQFLVFHVQMANRREDRNGAGVCRSCREKGFGKHGVFAGCFWARVVPKSREEKAGLVKPRWHDRCLNCCWEAEKCTI